MLRIFFATSVSRALLVVLCLVLGLFAEGIGIAALLPVFSLASGDAAGGGSDLERYIRDLFDLFGLPLSMAPLLLVVIGGLWIKAGLTHIAMSYVGTQVAEVATSLRLNLIEELLNVRWSYFTRQPVGRFTNAISSEAARASEAYFAVANIVAFGLQALAYLALALLVSWKLSLASAVIGGVITLSLNRLVRITRKAGRQQTGKTQSLVQRLNDTLVGIKPLKAMARHVRLGSLFAKDARDLNEALRRQVVSKQALRNLQEPLLGSFVCIGIYMASTYMALPFAEFVLMAALLIKTVLTINKGQQHYQVATITESAYWAMHDTIAEARAQREVATGTKPPHLARRCVFDNVSFAFGDNPILDRISLEIPAGVVTAITGASGAGKTTIADLLLGLLRPDSGAILIDDLPLAEADLTRWREMVGYVPQDVILFHDSVLANVTLGDPGYSRDDVQTALEAAGAHDFVAQLPNGLDSIVGERGALLSGGQRQRIAVARALIHRPALLILDEATSALDPETEASICRNLKDLSRRTGLTIVAISHQPAWVSAADRVYHLSRSQATEVTAGPARLAVS